MQMESYYTTHNLFINLSVGQILKCVFGSLSAMAYVAHLQTICRIPSVLKFHTDNTGLIELGDDAFAGWFNLLGQVAVTAAIEYSLANHLACMIVLGTGGAGTGGHVVTQGQLLGIYAGAAFVFFSMVHS